MRAFLAGCSADTRRLLAGAAPELHDAGREVYEGGSDDEGDKMDQSPFGASAGGAGGLGATRAAARRSRRPRTGRPYSSGSVGLPPGSPSLGELLKQGKDNLQAPWLGITAFFGIAFMLSLLVFIGEAVRDAFDPRKVQG